MTKKHRMLVPILLGSDKDKPWADKIIKELSQIRWIFIYKKPNFIGISLNTEYKKEIIEFIENKLSYLNGIIR